MISKRFIRTLTAGSLSASLLLGLMLAAPLATLAAVPAGWRAPVPTSLPATVAPGKAAGFAVQIYNDGPSTISQLYLFTPLGTRDQVYVQPSQGSCNVTGPLMCSLGQFKPSPDPITVVVAFGTDAGESGQLAIDFIFNTTGPGSQGGNDQSHGDELRVTGTTTFSADNVNFTGGFATPGNSGFNTSLAVGPGNLFGTSYNAPPYIPVNISDDVNYSPCPVAACYGTGTQNAVRLTINSGNPVPVTPFPVVVKIYKDAVPKGSNGNKVVVDHYLDNGDLEQISNDCPKNQTPTMKCRTVDWDGRSGVWTVTVWLFENGYVKYH